LPNNFPECENLYGQIKEYHRISIGELFPVRMYVAKARKAPAIGISLTLSQYVLIFTI
jgi:hypothetical protein